MLNQTDAFDRLFQALADPSRRAMIDRLSQGPASVSELAKPLAMSLPGVVQHLALLEQAGLVTTKKVGRVRECSLDTAALTRAETWLSTRRTAWAKRLDRLETFLKADPE